MTACLLALGIAMTCPPPLPVGPQADPLSHAQVPPADLWLAEDKLRHFAMSFATTAFAYAGARFALEPDAAVLAAAAAGLAAGIGKEIYDVRVGRGFSVRDLAWDAAGVALGIALVHHIR